MSQTRLATGILLAVLATASCSTGWVSTARAGEAATATATTEPAGDAETTGGSGKTWVDMVKSGGWPLFIIIGLFLCACALGITKLVEFYRTRKEKLLFADCVIVQSERNKDLAAKAFPLGEVPPEDSEPYVKALVVGAKSKHCAADLDGASEMPASATALIKFALGHKAAKPEDLELALDNKIELDMLPDLRKWVGWLATIAKGAPMLGLLGTVWGMIGAFARIASATNVNPNELADNIGFALTTTAAGLFAAIPALLFHAICQSSIRSHEMTLRKFAAELVDQT